jgi:branched-chain amino acid transport system substrate-binding protein
MDIARRFSRLSLLALVSVAAHSSPAPAQVPGVTGDTIKIGTFGPLTGPNYLFGKLVMNGAEIVYNEANKAGGIHGRKLVLVREDDRCDPATAIAAGQEADPSGAGVHDQRRRL